MPPQSSSGHAGGWAGGPPPPPGAPGNWQYPTPPPNANRPRPKRWPIWAAVATLVIIIVAIAAAAGGNGNDKHSKSTSTRSGSTGAVTSRRPRPAFTTTAATTTTLPAPIPFDGTGDDVIQIRRLDGADAPVLLFATCQCSGNFIVENSDESDVPVNAIGAYSGQVILGLNGGSSDTQLQVTADGPWHIEVRPMAGVRTFDTQPISGHGDDVIRYKGPGGPIHFSNTTSQGGNFIVQTLDQEVPVNEIGNYDGRVLVDGGSVLAITSDGDWTATPG